MIANPNFLSRSGQKFLIEVVRKDLVDILVDFAAGLEETWCKETEARMTQFFA